MDLIISKTDETLLLPTRCDLWCNKYLVISLGMCTRIHRTKNRRRRTVDVVMALIAHSASMPPQEGNIINAVFRRAKPLDY